eukprot:m.652704 g.652704  ORF g.652704 m.652704 type:complete len:407 (+) comp22691_c2_seq9:2041-3261(+)
MRPKCNVRVRCGRHCDASSSVDAENALTHWKDRLRAVGLSQSKWRRPYHMLSRGEQHQANIARVLGRHSIAIDEFTNFLDRRTAKSVAVGIGRYCRRHNIRGLVLVGCHADIAEDMGAGLRADWIYAVDVGELRQYTWPRATDALLQSTAPAAADDTDAPTSPLPNNGEPTSAEGNGPTDATKWNPLSSAVYLRQAVDGVTLETGSDGYVSAPSPGRTVPTVRCRVPTIHLVLRRCHPQMWVHFRDHHYKSKALSRRADTFVLTVHDKSADGTGSHTAKVLTDAPLQDKSADCSPTACVGFVAVIPHNGGADTVTDTISPRMFDPPGCSGVAGADNCMYVLDLPRTSLLPSRDVRACMRVCLCVAVCVCVCTCRHTQVCSFVHLCTCVHSCVPVCASVYSCVCAPV